MALAGALAAAVAKCIATADGAPFRIDTAVPVGGGSIHRAWRVSGGGRCYFVKVNEAAALEMFHAEADGLAALAAGGLLRVPRIVGTGRTAQEAFLVLEALDLHPLDRDSGARLGERLAALHRVTADEAAGWGWPRDNFIGANPQANDAEPTWALFFARRRLQPQLALAAKHGLPTDLRTQGERLVERVATFFVSYQPAPSLLHGDLWSGNAARLADGTPVVFDPAVYRGDREADLAMTELFGGFPESFYAAYRAAWPLDAGYETRKTLYNLYHVLNHFNLFGSAYLGEARRMIGRLRAALGG